MLPEPHRWCKTENTSYHFWISFRNDILSLLPGQTQGEVGLVANWWAHGLIQFPTRQTVKKPHAHLPKFFCRWLVNRHVLFMSPCPSRIIVMSQLFKEQAHKQSHLITVTFSQTSGPSPFTGGSSGMQLGKGSLSKANPNVIFFNFFIFFPQDTYSKFEINSRTASLLPIIF